jgi:hypothetical protein
VANARSLSLMTICCAVLVSCDGISGLKARHPEPTKETLDLRDAVLRMRTVCDTKSTPEEIRSQVRELRVATDRANSTTPSDRMQAPNYQVLLRASAHYVFGADAVEAMHDATDLPEYAAYQRANRRAAEVVDRVEQATRTAEHKKRLRQANPSRDPLADLLAEMEDSRAGPSGAEQARVLGELIQARANLRGATEAKVIAKGKESQEHFVAGSRELDQLADGKW